jgi:uncharacterized small protein (DUF1192 family)
MDDLYYAMQDFHRLTEANDALQAQVAQRDAEIAALREEVERLKALCVSAFKAGAARAHDDTVEGRYSIALQNEDEPALEWVDKALLGEGE